MSILCTCRHHHLCNFHSCMFSGGKYQLKVWFMSRFLFRKFSHCFSNQMELPDYFWVRALGKSAIYTWIFTVILSRIMQFKINWLFCGITRADALCISDGTDLMYSIVSHNFGIMLIPWSFMMTCACFMGSCNYISWCEMNACPDITFCLSAEQFSMHLGNDQAHPHLLPSG